MVCLLETVSAEDEAEKVREHRKAILRQLSESDGSAAEPIDDLEKPTDGKDPPTGVTEPPSGRKAAVVDLHGNKEMLAEIVVSPDSDEHFQTIGEALRKIRPGGRIRVRPGVYRESLVIDKPVKIMGEQEPGGKVVIESTEGPCLSISADRGTLKGLILRRLENPYEQRAEYRTAVTISAGQVTVEKCDITSAAGTCIIVRGSEANPSIRRCKIHHGEGHGLLVHNDGEGLVEKCDIFSNASAGVRTVGRGANPTIRRCDIHNNKQGGVFVYSNGEGLVEDCDIFGNASAGVRIGKGANPTIRSCKIYKNKRGGVLVYNNGEGLVEDCDISSNTRAGVRIEEGASPTIRSCKIIYNNTQSGVIIWRGKGVVEGCDIFGNAHSGIYIRGRANLYLSRCTITGNGYEAIRVSGGSVLVTHKHSKLEGNARGPWKIEDGAKVYEG